MYRGVKYNGSLPQAIKVETIVPEETTDAVDDKVRRKINTENNRNGKIFLYDMQDAARTCTNGRLSLFDLIQRGFTL